MSLTLHEHPFAAYCWKALIALYERDVPFERRFVGDAADRAALQEIWPLGSIPVLVDDGRVLPESTAIIEHLDGLGDAPPLVPADPATALQARLWDRIVDGHVATPMQKIVGDELRPEGGRDPEGVRLARADLERAYDVLDDHVRAGGPWLAGEDFTLADCAAAPALFYANVVHRWDPERRAALDAYYAVLAGRPSVARVIDEARPYRELFPLAWPGHVD
jgi:glutathione S-transferase